MIVHLDSTDLGIVEYRLTGRDSTVMDVFVRVLLTSTPFYMNR